MLTPTRPFRSSPLLSTHLRIFSRSFSSVDTTSKKSIDQRVFATEKWVRTIVAGEKGICPALCPFAPPLLSSAAPSLDNKKRRHKLLRIVSSDATSQDEIVQHLVQEVKLLMDVTEVSHASKTMKQDCGSKSHKERDLQNHHHETTLVVLNEALPFTQSYINFVRLSWEIQQRAVLDQSYDERHLQLVLFHPKATHQTYGIMSDEDGDAGAANYTIRSPYPTIHLLREKDIIKAVKSSYNTDGKLESLPSRNKERLISMGIDLCRQRLQSCYHDEKE